MNANKLFVIIGILLVGMLVVPVSASEVLTTSQFGAYSDVTPYGEPIGGGKGYSDIKTTGDCIATDYAEFSACLGSVTDWQIIYVPETANINLSGIDTTDIPANITIASNRGYEGSAGGRIFKIRLPTDKTKAQMTAINSATLNITGDNIRITGLRIEGADKLTTDFTALNIGMKYGILNWGHHNLTVDNNEMWGWSWAAIAIRNASVPVSNATVNYNFIHHCQEYTNGYGVAPSKTAADITGNLFANTKHAITGDGDAGETYLAAYNIVLDRFSTGNGQAFDVHLGSTTPLGGLYVFHHNTVLFNDNFAIKIRETPSVPSLIYWNEFQDNIYQGGKTSPVGQIGGEGNITMWNNFVNGSYWASGTVMVE